MLKKDFVVGWKNIVNEKFVGESHGYGPDQCAVGTTNGAGPRNTQLFVLSPDGVVLHVLPGFWHPQDLAHELRFAQRLHTLWKDSSKSRAEKKRLFAEMQMAALKTHSPEMTARSGWQGFDAKDERKRQKAGKKRDTFLTSASGRSKRHPRMKPINVLTHERMAKRPFVRFEDFDTPEFADYGRLYYDNNRRVDRTGIKFMTPRRVAKVKAAEAKKKARLEKRRRMSEERRERARAQQELRKEQRKLYEAIRKLRADELRQLRKALEQLRQKKKQPKPKGVIV